MDRYIGPDAHSSSCTVAVIGSSGKRLQTQVLETNAKVLIDFIRAIPGNRHLCFEEGTHSLTADRPDTTRVHRRSLGD
jgi:hypothetical protein